jgi:hypothetical protein
VVGQHMATQCGDAAVRRPPLVTTMSGRLVASSRLPGYTELFFRNSSFSQSKISKRVK